jgi:transcriptional antiterminator NusG
MERIFNYSLESSFSEIYIPEESIMANVKGKKRTIKKKFFPGYILIKMVMNDKTWHLVRNTDKITGFIGANKNKPSPLTEEEATFLTRQVKEGFASMRVTANFSEGDSVRVIEGPFASFVGTVETVTDKGKVRVQVSIFGRPTPVELDFTQVEKV